MSVALNFSALLEARNCIVGAPVITRQALRQLRITSANLCDYFLCDNSRSLSDDFQDHRRHLRTPSAASICLPLIRLQPSNDQLLEGKKVRLGKYVPVIVDQFSRVFQPAQRMIETFVALAEPFSEWALQNSFPDVIIRSTIV